MVALPDGDRGVVPGQADVFDRRARRGRRPFGQGRWRLPAAQGDAQVDQLHGSIEPVAVAGRMQGVEGRFAAGRIGPGHVEGPGLALVAQIQAARDRDIRLGHPFGPQLGAAGRFQFPVQPLQFRLAQARQRRDAAARELPRPGRHQHAQGREHPGVDRHQGPAHAQGLGQGAHVQAAGTAEGNQGVIPGIDAALHGDHPQGMGHVLVGKTHDAFGHRQRRHVQPCRQRVHGAAGRRLVQPHAAAEEGIGTQAPQQQIGIGDRGPGTAAPVAGRPRIGAGRLGPHLQQAAGIHVGDGAAAGADGMHVHHRHRHRPAGDAAFGGQADVALDERHVGGGAAHVEGEQPFPAGQRAQETRRGQAAGRPRQQHAHRLAAGLGRFDGAARALHHGQGRPRRQAGPQALQIAVHQRPHVGIEPSGHAPFVFTKLGQDRRGATDEACPAAPFHKRLFDAPLEAIILPGIEQIDGHRLGMALRYRLDQRLQIRVGQLLQHLAVRPQPAAGFQAVVAGHRRRDRLRLQVVQLAPGLAADGQQITQSAIGHEHATHALALEHGIGGHRGAVHDAQPVASGVAEPQLFQPLQDGPLRRGRRGQHLVGDQLPVPQQDEIGERATGVDAQQQRHAATTRLRPACLAA